MSGQGIGQILVYAAVLIALAYPLGLWMARVYTSRRIGGRVLGSLESGFCRLVRVDPNRQQDWKSYAKTVLVFSVVFSVVVYAIQRLQSHLFLNPDHLKASPRISRSTRPRASSPTRTGSTTAASPRCRI